MPIQGTISAAPTVAPTPAAPVRFAPTTAPPAAAPTLTPPVPPTTAAAPPAPPAEAAPDAGEGTEGGEGEGQQIESWRVAAIAKKEAAARKLAEQARQDREAAERLREEARAESTRARQEMELLRRDPTQFIRTFGIDYYNQLSQVIAQGGFTPEQETARAVLGQQQQLSEAEKRIAEVEKRATDSVKELEARLAKQEQERVEQERQAAIEEFRGEIGEFLAAEPTYKTVAKLGDRGVDAMYAVVEEQYEKTGKTIGLGEAAKIVQERVLAEARDFLADPDIRKLVLAGLEGGAPPAPRTLTNRMPPAPATPAPAPGTESEAERRARVVGQIERAWGRR